MKQYTPDFSLSAGFEVIGNTTKSQAAVMILDAGEKVGGERNTHDADQWVFIIGGEGKAKVEDKHVELLPGKLLLIEAGESHSIQCSGDQPLKTLNFYAPAEFEPLRH